MGHEHIKDEVLFISEKNSMLIHALKEGMRYIGLSIVDCGIDVAEISHMDETPRAWLLYLQDIDSRYIALFEYIQKQVDAWDDILFFMIGNPDELEKAREYFRTESICYEFKRPFRSDEVAERVQLELHTFDTLNTRKHILVVDDDATTLRAIKNILSSRYRVYTANSGVAAIRMLARMDIDLILMDYEMPIVKGDQVLEMIRNEPETKDVPVMFLTSKNNPKIIKNAMDLKAENFLLKSLSHNEILRAIGRFFGTEEETK